MNIKKEQPPNIDAIIKAFPALEQHRHRVVFAYGDTIYNPSGQPLPTHLIIHESTHAVQQGDDPASWWEKYLSDAVFRKEQEIEAYAHQYRFIKDKHGVSKADRMLFYLASDLSSPLYNLGMTYAEAEKAIKAHAKALPEDWMQPATAS